MGEDLLCVIPVCLRKYTTIHLNVCEPFFLYQSAFEGKFSDLFCKGYRQLFWA